MSTLPTDAVLAALEARHASLSAEEVLAVVRQLRAARAAIDKAATDLFNTATGGHPSSGGTKSAATRRLDSEVAAVRRALRELVPAPPKANVKES